MQQANDEIEIATCPHFHFATRGQELHFCSIHRIRMCSGCWNIHSLAHLNDQEFRRGAESGGEQVSTKLCKQCHEMTKKDGDTGRSSASDTKRFVALSVRKALVRT